MAKRKGSASVNVETVEGMTKAVEVESVVKAGIQAEAALTPSAEGLGGNARMVLQVDAESVLLDQDISKLRRWDGVSEQEMGVPELARTILEETQLEPCIVRPNGDGDLVLVAGHRRRAAVIYLKETGQKVETAAHPKGEDVLLDVIVMEMSDSEALRRAMLENVQRADFTAIEMARNIQTIRKRFDWEGKQGTAEVASFMGVSPATVTEKEKLLTLPAAVQEEVQAGRITPNAALELAKTGGSESVKAEVLEKAKKLADKEAEEKRKRKAAENEAKRQKIAQARVSGKGKGGKTAGKAGKTSVVASEEVEEEQTTPEPEPESVKAAPVTSQHVRRAAGKVEGTDAAAGKGKAPRMGEMCELMDGWNSPAANPVVMCKLAEALSSWGHGKLNGKRLQAAWDDVCDAIPTKNTATATRKTKPVKKLGSTAKKQGMKSKKGKTGKA